MLEIISGCKITKNYATRQMFYIVFKPYNGYIQYCNYCA